MEERDQRLAAAKRKLQEYKAQQRLEAEKKSTEATTNVNNDSGVAIGGGEKKEISHNGEPKVIPFEKPLHVNGSVSLTIDEEVIAPKQMYEKKEELPAPPTSIEFPEEENAEIIGVVPLDTPKNANGVEVADECSSNSNTNTSPALTPHSQVEKAADVREWVEKDTFSKRQSIELANPPLLTTATTFNENLSNSYDREPSHNNEQQIKDEYLDMKQENAKLKNRERELINQLQNVEQVIQRLKVERDGLKELTNEVISVKQQLSKAADENTEFRVIVSDLRGQLNLTLDEKEVNKKRLEEMQAAFIKVSNSKRDLESNSDIERERMKLLEGELKNSCQEIEKLRTENKRLAEKEDKYDSIIHSRDEEIKEFQNRIIKLEKQIHDLSEGRVLVDNSHTQTSSPLQVATTESIPSQPDYPHQQRRMDSIEEADEETDQGHEHHHSHDDHDHPDHGGCESQSHHKHDHVHGACESHKDEHTHNQDHEHQQQGIERLDSSSSSSDGPSPMEKKLARLEWENLTYREELDKVAALLKSKTVDSNALQTFREDNEKLRGELGRLEHLVVQLQGENDTIGDYISLYQTQKLVLKEKVIAKDREMQTLSQERAELGRKMEELNVLLKNFEANGGEGKPVEKINQLITSINSSSATLSNAQPFTPCSVCSGSLMTV